MGSKRKGPARDRRAKIEEMRRKERATERRRTIIFITISAVLGVGIVAAAAAPAVLDAINDPAKKPISSFGVGAAEAGCGEVQSDPAQGSGEHVQGQTVDYETVPPSSGPHWDVPMPFERHFYTPDDRPEMERLVHNLEHGYAVVWYDETITGDEREALEGLAEKIPSEAGKNKFIVSAWDPAYGEFEEGKHIGMSRWTKSSGGKRRLCERVSGEAISAFMDQFPVSDSPEPQGR